MHGNRYLVVDFGVIRPKGDAPPARLADLSRRLDDVVDRLSPEEAAVETPFTGRNPRSAFVLAQARGAILAVFGARRITVADYTPADVKKSIVGTGRAEKTQVVFMVTRLLGLEANPPQDAADAMAVALTHIHNAPARRRLP